MSGSRNDSRVPFVGRVNELTRISTGLGAGRPVTLVGPGGAGKTRLANQATEEAGFIFVPLGGATDGSVFHAAATALGVHEEPGIEPLDAIEAALRETPRALVIDNCEHVLAEARELCMRIARVPGAQVLATSRRRLDIENEDVIEVGPLEATDARVFVLACLQTKTPSFRPNEEDEARIAAVATALDGLPIAIQLAVSRIPSVTLAHLARMLRNVAPRHLRSRDPGGDSQALDSTIGWSLSLLSDDARHIFECCLSFVDWFDAADLAEIEEMSIERARAALDELDEHSLVVERAPGRYALLAPIRVLARQRVDSRRMAMLARRHAIGRRDAAIRVRDEFVGKNLLGVVAAIGERYDDYRTALEWTLHEPDRLRIAVDLIVVMTVYWAEGGHISEGLTWTRRALNAANENHSIQPADAGHIAYAYARACHAAADYAAIVEVGPALTSAYTRVGDKMALGRAYNLMSVVALCTGAVDDAKTFGEMALCIHRAIGHWRGVAAALCNLGNTALDGRSDPDAAIAYYQESLEIARQPGGEALLVLTLGNLGEAHYAAGRFGEAAQAANGSLEGAELLGNESYRAWGHQMLARIALARGEIALAQTELAVAIRHLEIEPNPEYAAAGAELAARLALARGKHHAAMRLFAAATAFRDRRRLLQIGPTVEEARVAAKDAASFLQPEERAQAGREGAAIITTAQLMAASKNSLEVGVRSSHP